MLRYNEQVAQEAVKPILGLRVDGQTFVQEFC